MNLTRVFLFIISVLCIPVESIINGTFITIKEAPYFVSLVIHYKGLIRTIFCGGTIISESWIITAGHCTDIIEKYGTQPLAAFPGSSTKKEDGKVYEFEKIIVHGDYDSTLLTIDSDIALIKLKKPINFDENEQPIKISSKPPEVGDTLQLSGMGTQGRARGVSKILKSTEVTVISREECQEELLPYLVTDNVFCANGNTTDSCYGDSGGPIVKDGKLIGIVSWGMCDGYIQKPGAYTRIDLFYDWILKHTGIKY